MTSVQGLGDLIQTERNESDGAAAPSGPVLSGEKVAPSPGSAGARDEGAPVPTTAAPTNLLSRLRLGCLASLPWTGTQPFRWMVMVGLAAPMAVFAIEAVIYPDTRLQVYTVEVAIVFLLGFVVLEGERARQLESRSNRLDLTLAFAGIGLLVLWNLGLGEFTGYQASPRPGFGDAMVLILAAFVALYGLRNLRPMIAPLSLLAVFLGITIFVSNDNPEFYALIGHYFVQWNVWMSANLIDLLGHPAVAGPDYFLVIGPPSLYVQMWLRCSGLDVASLYSILIGYFTWQTTLSLRMRLAVIAGVVGGAFVVNSLRVAALTILFLNYPPQFIESVHTNLGDLVFLGYAAVIIAVLRRYR